MQKIKSITLRNFKYFYGKETEQPQNKIELDKDNLLLYGENGSGKSSIYWGLYTFLQSAIKDPRTEIEKYFDPEDNQNLRNRFADTNDESGVIVEFIAPSGGTIKELKRNTDGSYSINTFQDAFVNRVLVGSDFINYKFLSKIYDFRNSEHIDLFEMFERDILMFIDFEEAYTQHDGTLSTKTYASDWWKFICSASATLPFNGNIVSVSSEEYRRFKNTTLPRFVELLKRFLHDITQGANEYLQEQFKEDFTISFDTENITCEYNKNISQRAKDGKLHKPSIPLKVHFNHDSLVEANKQILKPHTFLNEARLTAIALAIRLSILDRRPTLPNSARILVLDDLLLSLDMSHRDKVLDILLSPTFIDTYQILILTHDRAFYNMCKNRIQDRFEKGWIFKEMYQHQTDSGIPCPFVPKQSNYLDLAKKYLKEFDYPASANYLRKEAERVFKYLLPRNLSLYFKEDKGMITLQLDNLISNFLKYFNELGGNIEPFKKIKEHKDLLLNPLSHDNTESPIYRRELDNIIKILEKLNQLKVHTIGLDDDLNEYIFELHETDSVGDNWTIEFTLKETYRGIKDLDANWYLSNPKCHFLSKQNTTQNTAKVALGNDVKLGQGYGNIRYALGIKTDIADNEKDLKEVVFKDGQKLIDILNA
ncbi:ATP-binding protein [Epilithonimonas vandammei]|uniref:ATP-binding protein n=2 Tax=Weeksellaceae TaxID=2762318 RepID=UPI0028A04D1C|nr:ATP-binding protein [Epilithonimonas vandammei]